MENPKTKFEWQSAANAAYALLAIESAKMYGLIAGGPKVNVERCEEILILAQKKGIKPSETATKDFLSRWNLAENG